MFEARSGAIPVAANGKRSAPHISFIRSGEVRDAFTQALLRYGHRIVKIHGTRRFMPLYPT